MSDAQTPHAYMSAFPGIAVRLHPERIREGDARIWTRLVTDRDELGDFFTASRATRTRMIVRLGAPFSYPLRIREMVARMGETTPSFQAPFDVIQDDLAASGGVPAIEIPAYDLGEDGVLLLDGNHRAVALYRSQKRFRLTLSMLSAPVDRRILTDLRYFDGGLKRFARRLRG